MDVDPGAKPEIIFGSYKMGENDLYRKPHGAFGPGFASFTNKKDVFLIFFHPDETLKVETPTFRPKSSVTSGFLIWNIPADGSYSFTCNGAGNVAPEHIRKKKNWPRILATGAEVTGKFDLKRGDRLEIILGQHGSNWQCGSGGTFVYRSTPTKKELLIAAGGAGGVSGQSFKNWYRGTHNSSRRDFWGNFAQISAKNFEIWLKIDEIWPNTSSQKIPGLMSYAYPFFLETSESKFSRFQAPLLQLYVRI